MGRVFKKQDLEDRAARDGKGEVGLRGTRD